MNRISLGLLTGALLTAPALAAANPEIYGRAHLSADLLSDGSEAGLHVSSNSSRLGLRGSQALDDRLTLRYQIEQTVNLDTTGGALATRDSFLGVEGDFGLVRAGYISTPFRALRSEVDLFGEKVGDARNIVSGTENWDSRFRRAIHYRSPDLNGITFDAMYSSSTDERGGSDLDDSGISLAASYRSGPLYAAAAFQVDRRAGDDDLTGFRLAGYYDLADDLRITGLLQHADGETGDDTAIGGGVRYSAGAINYMSQLYWLIGDGDDSNALMLALGADRELARNLVGYVAFALMLNDDAQYLRPYRRGRGADPDGGSDGDTTSGISVGAIYTF